MDQCLAAEVDQPDSGGNSNRRRLVGTQLLSRDLVDSDPLRNGIRDGL
jgi:hypothetical protein